MIKEIKTRQKRFGAFLLAVVLVWNCLVPMTVKATEYTTDALNTTVNEEMGEQILYEGDTITTSDNCEITYLDVDDSSIESMPTETITATAPYTVKAYSGTLDTEKYEFTGWKVTDIWISAGMTGSITLSAMYEAKDYKITYELDGGINAEGNPATYTVGEGVTKLEDAEKYGYTFEGWYEDTDYSIKVESISTDRYGDMILYAKYTPNICSIIYELDGGTNDSSNPDTYTVGVGVESLAPATKEGYTFEAWYRGAGNSTVIESISKEEVNDIRLYAKFNPNSYSITYELNEGTNASENPSTYTVGTGVSGFANASKEGYTFEGWYSNADFTEKVESITTEQTGDVTLYAKFTLNETSSDSTVPEESVSGALIQEGGVLSAKAGTAYSLGSGTWKVSGDNTSYAGGITFYVSTDGEYEFTLE